MQIDNPIIMNKLLKLFFAVIVVPALVTSCDSDDTTAEVANFVTFEDSSLSTAVPQNGSSSYDIKVYANNESGSARTFNVNVDESSSLSADSYDVPATVTIPANSNEGTLTVMLSDTNISNSGDVLTLRLEGNSGMYFGGPVSLNVLRDCPSDLAGTYSVLTSGQSTDPAAPDPVVDLPYTVTITKTGANTYTVSDIFAGIYIDWYCEAYDYCAETEGSFTDVCGTLSADFTEPFGESASLSGTVNDDNTLTISFQNAFGDMATSVYTKM